MVNRPYFCKHISGRIIFFGVLKKACKRLTYKPLYSGRWGSRTHDPLIKSQLLKNSKSITKQELIDTEKHRLQTSLQEHEQKAKAEQNLNLNPPADLVEVIEVWSDLPGHIKQTIRTLAAVTAKEKGE